MARLGLTPCPADRYGAAMIASLADAPRRFASEIMFRAFPGRNRAPFFPGRDLQGRRGGCVSHTHVQQVPHRRRCGPFQHQAATPRSQLPENNAPFRPRSRTQDSSKNSSSKPAHDTDSRAQSPWDSSKVDDDRAVGFRLIHPDSSMVEGVVRTASERRPGESRDRLRARSPVSA